jgi:hypothetical protein
VGAAVFFRVFVLASAKQKRAQKCEEKRVQKSAERKRKSTNLTVKGPDQVFKNNCYNKSNGHNFEKFNATIKLMDLIFLCYDKIIRHNFTKCNVSDTFNEKNHRFKKTLYIFSWL